MELLQAALVRALSAKQTAAKKKREREIQVCPTGGACTWL
jgi:hypothetical protein